MGVLDSYFRGNRGKFICTFQNHKSQRDSDIYTGFYILLAELWVITFEQQFIHVIRTEILLECLVWVVN